MRCNTRLGAYLAAALSLTVLVFAAPGAWATPDQSRPAQTVPTRTPKPGLTARPTATATVEPRPTTAPTATAIIEPSPTTRPTERASREPTPPPQNTATATPEPAIPTPTPTTAVATLRLEKRADRSQVWPGVAVHYTLTLTNSGAATASEVTLSDTLPAGLDPGSIAAGMPGTWDGRTLRVQADALPPGAQLIAAFDATVRLDAAPGGVLINRAAATAAGGLSASASVTVVLPPAEMPPTGGDPGTVPSARPREGS